MQRHETPTAVAAVLVRHAPRACKRILDPAVGNGVLLEPFKRLAGPNAEIYAIDIDSQPLKRVRRKLGPLLNNKLKIIKSDFLRWSLQFRRKFPEIFFDCIVMNPPFAARRHQWKPLKNFNQTLTLGDLPKSAPIEAAFILSSVELLRPGGRLLAILPPSLMASPSLSWIRNILFMNGTIHHVHELSHFTFLKIESRMYVLVFEKGRKQNNTMLLNHDLLEPEKMPIQKETLGLHQRLDFGYHNSAAKISALKKKVKLGWRQLEALAMVRRGSEYTPNTSRTIVHTDHYISGFWINRNGAQYSNVIKDQQIQDGDLLVKRVSRNCSRSFGLAWGIQGALGSDCVLIIRPKSETDSCRLLFALRSLMAVDFIPAFVEKGTGARYLSQIELRKLEVPYDISEMFPRPFHRYVMAVRRRSFNSMQKIETYIKEKLLL